MPDSINRFDRIVAILIQLQSKRVVKAQDLSDRFDVSLRTIYRDLKSLENAGVPIFGEAGSGYSLVDGYRLPPVMFSREEAGSFVAAEKLMQKFTDKSLHQNFESAMFKVKSVLRGNEKEWVSALDTVVSINHARTAFNAAVPDAMEIIFECMADKKRASLAYLSPGAKSATQRIIEPIGLFHENQHWYIMAFCHLRNDYRQFRIDRIQKIQRSEEPFSRKHGTLDDYRRERPGETKTRIKILVDRCVSHYLKFERDYYGFEKEEIKGDKVAFTFNCSAPPQSFCRWYLMFGDSADIIEPESLKDILKNIIKNTVKKLES